MKGGLLCWLEWRGVCLFTAGAVGKSRGWGSCVRSSQGSGYPSGSRRGLELWNPAGAWVRKVPQGAGRERVGGQWLSGLRNRPGFESPGICRTERQLVQLLSTWAGGTGHTRSNPEAEIRIWVLLPKAKWSS